MNEDVRFSAGTGIAIKIPAHEFERTVKFYRDVIGLPVIREAADSLVLAFGDKQLWLDRIEHFTKAEIWLELKADDVAGAREHIRASGIVRPEEIETRPGDSTGFWVTSPCNMIHRISEEE